MLIRYVRMTFGEDKTEEFQQIFNDSKDKIKAMGGCQYLSSEDLFRSVLMKNGIIFLLQ